MIGAAAGSENFAPAVLGVAEHQRNEVAHRVGRRAGVHLGRLSRLSRVRAVAGKDLCSIQQHTRINAEVPADQPDNDDGADAQTASAAWNSTHPARCALLAIVFDVVAGPEVICLHLAFSRRLSPLPCTLSLILDAQASRVE